MSNKTNCLPVHGILLVNKPQGLSSNAVLQQTKRLYNARKAGHTGSLDPLATGMLPICFGEATKFCQYLLDADKCYQATGLLGVKTTTADALGEVISTHQKSIALQDLEKALQHFTGTIKQVPSMYSALKHQGQPLYKYARQGIDIARPAREVRIESIELISFENNHFTIKVTCSKGTYIRNLVEDIGEYLGTYAHVTALHRHFTAGFEQERMYSLDELKQLDVETLCQRLLPCERAVNYLPELKLTHEHIINLQQGKLVKLDLDTQTLSGLVRILDLTGKFFGLGELDNQEIKVKRLLAVS